jgi:ribosomal protein L37E
MNWYTFCKVSQEENYTGNWHVLDTQLLCCGYPKNRRKDPYKPNKKKKK